MKNKRLISAMSWLLLVCLIVGLTGCGGPTPTPPPDLSLFSCKGTPLDSETATNGFYIDDQVIVIGPSKDVDEVVRSLVVKQIPVELNSDNIVEDCSLSYLSDGREIQQRPPLFDGKVKVETLFSNPKLTEDQRKSLVMRLYNFPQNIYTAKDVSDAINAKGNIAFVYADPNYLTDPSAGSCGDPFSGGGSPFSGGGSTYAVPGSVSSPPPDRFVEQWAFMNNKTSGNEGSITLLPADSTAIDQAVRIGVFDTLSEEMIPRGFASEKTVTVILPDQNSVSFDLYVSSRIKTQIIPREPPDYDISEHGLFVAGLVHAVAPKSEIHLIRVLNQDGCGDLFVISKAIHDFASRMSANIDRPNLNRVVINLSLGVHQPYERLSALNREKLESLEEAIGDAFGLGATIIAAAGNDSLGDDPAVMQLPASYEIVIGVAANNKNGERSCYSNSGDISAPGGDGGVNLSDQTDTCVARVTNWWMDSPIVCSKSDASQCGYGLISLSKPTVVPSPSGSGAPEEFSTKYIFWVGTSFSTPLVTGLAARIIEQSGSTNNQVKCLILRGAKVIDSTVPGGRIDVKDSLSLDSAVCSSP